MDKGEQLTYSTVRIQAWDENDNESVGTGFIYMHPFHDTEENSIYLVVTNKHVIEHSNNGKISFHISNVSVSKSTPTVESEPVLFKDWGASWFMHPNPDIDLACMPLSGVHESFANSGKKTFAIGFGPQLIPSAEVIDGFSAIEEILMVGYPIGLWDQVHNRPLIRRGITASSLKLDFNGDPVFVGDMACFPGSSGSPVILIKGDNYYLLGVLYAGPVFHANGECTIEEKPTKNQGKTKTEVMVHLGYVIKSREIQTLVNALVNVARDPKDSRFNTNVKKSENE